MNRHWIKYAVLLLGLSPVVSVAADTATVAPAEVIAAKQGQVIVQRLLTLCRQGAFAKAKLDLTQDSHTWLDRWAAHDIHSWLPNQLWVTDQQVRGDRLVLWLSKPDDINQRVATNKTSTADAQDSVIVVLQAEAGRLKVDIPESMRLRFGAGWADTAEVIENSYSLAVRQFGKENSRTLLESLLNAY